MLKLPSRQALKALRNPFRSPLPNPLRGPLQTRHLHHEPVPFSGPPSYATLARRFSPSSPGPIRFFRQKAAKEAIERGEFVDIHDIGGMNPKDYDVLITEIDHRTLHSEISKLVDIPYLQEATKDEVDKVVKEIRGFFYGRTLCMIFPCILTIRNQVRWVFFIVDSGAPLTYISTEVAQAFGLMKDPEPSDPWNAKIAGYAHQIYLSPSDSHFSEVDNVEIPCKLIHCSINDAPSYTALSYTWGPPQPAHQIFVNEKRFSVRSNLWHFLNSLPRLRNYSEGCSTDATRRPESDNINAHEHVFWVDAVCINQDDVAERNLQVPRMKQIYENAESTLIWLGGDSPGSPARQISNIAFRFLGEVTRRGHRDSHELRRWINFDRGSEGKSRPESSRLWKSRWEAFDALCGHEYWTRTWIIQEVLLAKTVVLCGSEMMQPWSSFEALCRALDERPRPPLGYSTQVEGAVGKAESIPLQLVNDRIHRSVSSNRQLRRLLEAYSSSRSTITHDKIYGLLGLAGKSSDIQVDYSKDCLDLYLDTLEHVKPFRGTLGFCRLLAGRLNVALEYAELNNRARKRQMDGKPYFVRAAALCYGKVLDASFEWDRGVLTLRMRKLWNQTWHQNYPGTSQCHLGRAKVALRELNTSVNFEESECLFGKSFAWLSKDKEADEGDLKMLTAGQRPLDISAESDAVDVQAPSTKAILCQGGLIGRAPLRAEVGDLVCRLDAADVWLLVRLDQYGLKIVGQVSIAMVHSTSQLKLSEPFSVAPGKGDVGSPLSSVPDTSFYLEPGVLLYLSRLSISGFTKGSEVTESWLPDSTHHTNKVGRREDIPPYF